MSAHRDPDRLIASYFEQPMPELQDRVFDAVRGEIHGTRQRLVIWPSHISRPRLLLRAVPMAAALLLILSLGVVNLSGLGLGGQPTTPPGPTANVFRSPFYGYSIELAEGWTATPAAVRWDGESQPSLGPDVDQLAGPHLIALGFGGPFAGDLAAFTQDRIAASARDHADTCPPNALHLNEPISVGGQPGVLLGWNCGAAIEQAITVRGGVAYAFTIRDAAFSPTLDPADLSTLRSMLDSLAFPTGPTTNP